MRKMMNGVVAVLSVAIILSALPAFASASIPQDTRGAAPGFTLNTISGKAVSLSDLRGKKVMLFFYATWCPWCRKKFPDLVANYARYQSEGIELLVIDTGESREKANSFAQKQGIPFDILLDIDMKVAQDYDVVGVPTFVLINKEGKVVFSDNDLPNDYLKVFER